MSRRKRGGRGHQKTFTQEKIRRVIEELMMEDTSVNKFHSPEEAVYKDARVNFLISVEQYSILKEMLAEKKTTLTMFFKKLVADEIAKWSAR